MAKIIGRKEELKVLQSLMTLERSSFLAVYGRRRVGKTFLVRTSLEAEFTFHVTGLANVDMQSQLVNFHSSLVRFFPKLEDKTVADSWFFAFQNLITGLECLPKTGKKIIFLDELPWMDSPNSMFISALEHFWNSWASAREDILLIVCGSLASWMVNELINNTGGLYNRVTHRMRLLPFSLSECEAFFKAKNAAYDRYQIAQLYMVFGGIPFYLDMIEPAQSAAQNINRLCFLENSPLRNEFTKLYASLFKNSDRHIAIIEALSKKTTGLERTDLLKAAKLSNGGTASVILKELEESDFIRKYNNFGKNKNGSVYQLSDFYSLFYLRFIKNNNFVDENFWITGIDNPKIRAWSGYAFEQVCFAHLPQIKKALGVSSVQTKSSAWIGDDGNNKAQVDLIIDRRDHVINLCEIKFSLHPFVIDKTYEKQLIKKIQLFRQITGTNKSVWLTFITTFGLAKANYPNLNIQNSVKLDDLFD